MHFERTQKEKPEANWMGKSKIGLHPLKYKEWFGALWRGPNPENLPNFVAHFLTLTRVESNNFFPNHLDLIA